MSPADVAAHEASSFVRTAPLPAAAQAALSRLERAFIPAPLHVVRAVTRYEVAVSRRAELEAKPTREWSGAEFDSWVGCEQTIVESLTALVAAGRMDLVAGPVDPVFRAVADFRKAALRAAALSNEALSPDMQILHVDDLAHAEDVMAGARAVLAKAGALHLIGGAR
jgi:hypothetical protein